MAPTESARADTHTHRSDETAAQRATESASPVAAHGPRSSASAATAASHGTASPRRGLRACLALNAVQRVLSAAVLAPLVTFFLWQSPAFATATVCSCLQSLCSYEFAWLAHRIQHRLRSALQLADSLPCRSRSPSSRSSPSCLHTSSPTTSQRSPTQESSDSDAILAILQSSCSTTSGYVGGPTHAPRTPRLRTHSSSPAGDESSQVSAAPEPPQPTKILPPIDPTHCAISNLTTRLIRVIAPLHIASAATTHRLRIEWLVAMAVAATTSAVATLLLLLVVFAWLPQLQQTEIYRHRVFFAVATTYVSALCACFSPNARYAVVVFGESVAFTVLTLYSTVCPINQFSCAIALEPVHVLVASVGLLLVLRFTTSSNAQHALVLFGLDTLGFLYIVGTLSILVAFVDDDKRTVYRKLLIVLLYVTWASDTGAYLTGKALAMAKYPNYHPLAAHVSQNKDYEGTLGAVLCGLAAMFAASHVLDVAGCATTKALFTVLGVVVGRVGDLFESLLKRAAQVKDSGALIPGHGGVLDRIDALMFVTLVFARYYPLVLREEL